MDSFTQSEHKGWQRVAGQYDSSWSSSTRQFISPLLERADLLPGMSVLIIFAAGFALFALSAFPPTQRVGLVVDILANLFGLPLLGGAQWKKGE
jgi:hypothetical protein